MSFNDMCAMLCCIVDFLEISIRRRFPCTVHVNFLQLIVAWLIVTVVGHASGTTAAIKLAGDGVCDAAELLLLLVEVLGLGRGCVLLKPILGFLDGFKKLYN